MARGRVERDLERDIECQPGEGTYLTPVTIAHALAVSQMWHQLLKTANTNV